MARKARTAVVEPEQEAAVDAAPATEPVQGTDLQPTESTPSVDEHGAVTVHSIAGGDGQADDIQGFARIDPRKLVIGTNVRTKAEVAELVADVKERGVRVPIQVYTDEHGQHVVVAGQRRTLAAIAADRPYVPIMIVDRPENVALVVEQVHENDNRQGLSIADRIGAYEQLAAFGLSASAIAKKLHHDKKDVEAGLKVARAGNTGAIVAADPDLDVKAGAIIAELAEDDDALREQLIAAARKGTLDHEAQWIRDNRVRDVFKAQLLATLAEQNAIVVTRSTDNTAVAVSDLHDRSGNPLDPAAHGKCPGHAVYLAETGNLAEPWKVKPACRDYATYGHYKSGEKLRAADLSPEQRIRDKADRKNIIASNKAWESAQTVRRTWLTEYLTRKSLPKTAARFLLDSYARAGHQLTRGISDGHPLGTQLLGIKQSPFLPAKSRDALADMLAKASDARAQVIVLGLILGAYEEATNKNSWRYRDSDTARYLTFIAEQGYRLSNVEKRAAGQPLDNDQTADTADETDETLPGADDLDALEDLDE